MLIKTVYYFVDSNPGVEISSKKQGKQKKRSGGGGGGGGGRGGGLGVVLPGRGANNLPWGKKDLPGGPGVRANYTV